MVVVCWEQVLATEATRRWAMMRAAATAAAACPPLANEWEDPGLGEEERREGVPRVAASSGGSSRKAGVVAVHAGDSSKMVAMPHGSD